MNERILIVDDDEVTRCHVARLLRRGRAGCELIEADSVDSAYEAIHRREPDCTLLDFRLGDGTAFDLLSRFVERAEPLPSIVMLTGMGSEKVAVDALKLGVQDYLGKDDLDPDALWHTLEQAMHKAREARHRQQRALELEHLSLHDELTGLPNRRLFGDRLQQARLAANRNGSAFAVLVIDLDLFKSVNDRFGHAVGDRVLKLAAERMRAVMRSSDTLARTGGDEFAAILGGVRESGALQVANKMRAVVSEPLELDVGGVAIGASIGIAIFPLHGHELETLLVNADAAMYTAKQSREGPVVCGAAPAQRARADESRSSCLLEPTVALQGGAVQGLQVVARGDGTGPFALADTALDLLARLAGRGIELPVSIELSALSPEVGRLPDYLADALGERGVAPGLLGVEWISAPGRTDLMDVEHALNRLLRVGLRVGIAGSGNRGNAVYLLRKVSAHDLVLDRALIAEADYDARAEVVVRTLVNLGEGLGCRVIAPAVKNEQLRERLIGLGVRSGRGVALAPRFGQDSLLEWLAEHGIGARGHPPAAQAKG